MNLILRMLKTKVFQNSIWLFILQFANLVLPLLTIPYVTRVLGAGGYGEYSIAYNWMTYFQVFVEYGFALGGAKKLATSNSVEEDNDSFNEIITARMLLFIISLVLIHLLYFCGYIDNNLYPKVCILMLVVLSVVFQANWIFQGKQQMSFITIINVTGRLLSVLLIFLFVKNSTQVSLYCFFYSVTFLFSSFTGVVVAAKRYHLKYRLPNFRTVIRSIQDNFSLFASAAISRLFGNVGVTILALFAATEVVGGYSAVYKIPYIMTLCFTPIGQALFPYFSKRFAADKKGTLSLQKKIFPIILGGFILLGGIIICLRNFVVTAFLGKEYSIYADFIIFLILQMIFGVVNNFLGVQTLVATGLQKRYMACICIGVASLILCNILLTPNFGGFGTAMSAFFSEVMLTIALVYNCKKYVWKEETNNV